MPRRATARICLLERREVRGPKSTVGVPLMWNFQVPRRNCGGAMWHCCRATGLSGQRLYVCRLLAGNMGGRHVQHWREMDTFHGALLRMHCAMVRPRYGRLGRRPNNAALPQQQNYTEFPPMTRGGGGCLGLLHSDSSIQGRYVCRKGHRHHGAGVTSAGATAAAAAAAASSRSSSSVKCHVLDICVLKA